MSNSIPNPDVSYYATFWSEEQHCFVSKPISFAQAHMLLRAVSVPIRSRRLADGTFEHSGSAIDLEYVDQRREFDLAVKQLS